MYHTATTKTRQSTASKRTIQAKLLARQENDLEVLVDAEDVLRGGAAVEVGHDGGLLVLADALLEEVGLALRSEERRVGKECLL